MFTPEKMTEVSETQLRVAFDGDAVLFSDESERIFKAHGLDKFFEHEKAHENKPLDHVSITSTGDSLRHHSAAASSQLKAELRCLSEGPVDTSTGGAFSGTHFNA